MNRLRTVRLIAVLVVGAAAVAGLLALEAVPGGDVFAPYRSQAAPRVGAPPLPAPVLLSPATDTILAAFQATLQWTPTPGAVQEQIQVWPSSGDGPGVN